MHNDVKFNNFPLRGLLFISKKAAIEQLLQNNHKMDHTLNTSTKTLIHPTKLLPRLQFIVIDPT